MEQTLTFSCACGAIHGELRDTSAKTGTHAVCHCSMCRAAEVYLDQPDPKPHGVHVFQTSADKVHFLAGTDRLNAFSYRKGGLIRWYAGCCKVPLFNVVPRAKMGFASVIMARLNSTEALGKPKTIGFLPGKDGKPTHKGLHHTIFGILTRTAAMRFSGRWKASPFFDAGGAPIQPVHVLSKVEKSVLPLTR